MFQDSELLQKHRVDCSGPSVVCSAGVIAYRSILVPAIHYCPLFFSPTMVRLGSLCSGATPPERRSIGRFTLHEVRPMSFVQTARTWPRIFQIAHIATGAKDIARGCAASRELSDADKIKNADNFRVSLRPSCWRTLRPNLSPVLHNWGMV